MADAINGCNKPRIEIKTLTQEVCKSSDEILQALMKELATIRYELRENAITIEKKDKIIKRLGKSPNLADCVMYWNWMRKGYRIRHSAPLPFSAGE